MPQSITSSPFIARAYARIALGYLRDVAAELDRSQPFYILELGAGDGKFMLRVARLMARRWPNVEIVMVDRIDLIGKDVCNTFAEFGWRAQAVTARASVKPVRGWLRRIAQLRQDPSPEGKKCQFL